MRWFLKKYNRKNKSGPALRAHLLNCAKKLNLEPHVIESIFGHGPILGKMGISLDTDDIELWLPEDPEFVEIVDRIVDKYTETFL